MPPEPKFKLRPASLSEAGLFYALPPEKDLELGAIGHIRMDFGHGGNEFWHTWWPRGDEALNSSAFKDELAKLVDELRACGPLKSLSAMQNYCWDHGGALGENSQNYGYIAETEGYSLSSSSAQHFKISSFTSVIIDLILLSDVLDNSMPELLCKEISFQIS